MSYNSVSVALGKWVARPLNKLPRDLQRIATAYIPNWQILTPKERESRITEVDRQRGVKSKLRYDRAVRAQRTSDNEAEGMVGWFDTTLEADHWVTLGDVAPNDAAMLLCRFNPNEQDYENAMQTTTDELGPEHLIRLAQRLADIDKADHRPRTLRDWHQKVKELGLKHHKWIDGYMEATTAPEQVNRPKPQVQNPATPLSRVQEPAEPRVDAKGSNKSPKTIAFEKAVMAEMTTVWNQWKINRASDANLKEPTKGEMHESVLNLISEKGIKSATKRPTLQMVCDAAKPWKKPAPMTIQVSPSVAAPKRHAFKGDK